MERLSGVVRTISPAVVLDAPGVTLGIVTGDGPVAVDFPRDLSALERSVLQGMAVEYTHVYRESTPDRYGIYAQTHEYTLRAPTDARVRYHVIHTRSCNPHER